MPQTNEDEIQFETIFKQIKQKIFETAKTYLDKTESVNPIFLYLLIFVQTLQILWFSIHPLLDFENSPVLLNYARSAISYLNFQQSIRNNNSLLLPFMATITSITFIHIATLIMSIKSLDNKDVRKSEFINFIHGFASCQFILFNTILTIPIFNVSIIALYCQSGSPYHQSGQCYDISQIILCIFAGINMLVLIIDSLFYWFIFYLRNPFSKSYYALSNNLNKLGKLLIKILPSIYFVIDVQKKYQNIYVFIFLVLGIAYIGFFRIISIHNFYQNFFYFQLFMESVIAWFGLNAVICYQFPSSGMNFIQTIICSLLCGYAVCTVQAAFTKKFMIANIEGNIKKQDREKFMYILINILFSDQVNTQINPIVYIKMINSSSNVCNIKIARYIMKSDLKAQQMQQLARETLLLLLQNFLSDSSSTTLKLIKCNILYDSGLKILALHQITELRSDKLSVYEQFILYYFKLTHKIYESSCLKGAQQNVSQIQTYLRYVEHMNQFQNQLQNCAYNNEQYWEQLCQDVPSMNKIYNLAQKSVKYIKKIEQIFKQIQLIYPENIASLVLYYHFLTDVCVRNKECNKIKQKLAIEKQRQNQKYLMEMDPNENSKIKFKSNERMCVLHISTSSNQMGIIINCNSEVKRFLGYEKIQLMNQKVTKVMPKIFSQIHDSFIEQYLKRADSAKLPIQKNVFSFKKNLRIIQTSLAVKIFPNILLGFQLVGFFKQKNKKQETAYLMINLRTLQIEGMNETFIQTTGNRIKLAQVQKQPLKLSHLFPQIDPSHTFKANQQFETLFRFTDCTDKLIEIDETATEGHKKFQKNIVIKVHSINNYNGADIGILYVMEQQQIVSMHEASRIKKQSKANKPKHQKTKISNPNKYQKSVSEDQRHEQLTIERKIDDFINQSSYKNKICLVKIIFLLVNITLIVSMIALNIQKMLVIISPQLQDQMNYASDIITAQAKILTLNEQLILSVNNPQSWAKYKQSYSEQLNILQNYFFILFEKANERKQQLVINQFIQYSFKTLFENNTISISNLYYADGILQVSVVAKKLITYPISEFVQPVSQRVKQGRYYVQHNMNFLLPELAEKTLLAYVNLYSSYRQKLFIGEMQFVLIKNLLNLLTYLVMFFIITRFSNFTKLVFEMYRCVLKWDAYELYSKCFKFRTNVLESTNNSNAVDNPRKSDLFKVFPKSLFVVLTQGSIGKPKTQKKGQKVSITNRLGISKNKHMQQSKEELEKLVNQQQNSISQIMNTPIKGDLIQLSLDQKFTKQFTLILIFLIILISLNFMFLYLNYDIKNDLENKQINIQSFGNFTKSFMFTYFYGIKYLQNNSQYESLYYTQLSRFYEVSKTVSVFLMDNQSYIRQVYEKIQLLNSIVRGQLTQINQTTLHQYIANIESTLFQKSDLLNAFTENLTNNWMTEVQQSIKMIRIIKIFVDVILTIIFCKLVLFYLLKPIEKQIGHSINMIKMVPIWIIHKNTNIKEIVNANSSPGSYLLSMSRSPHAEHSSANLMVKSIMQ